MADSAASLQPVFDYVDANLDRFIQELRELCLIPSIGTDASAMQAAEHWLRDRFGVLGFRSQSFPFAGAHPFVFAVRDGGERSVLFFNHYDIADYTNPVVYPTDPDARGPFSGEISDGKLYARGATDDKGTLTARLHAAEALLAVRGALPVTTKFIVEGKAGVSNRALDEFVAQHHRLLAADCCLWEAGAKDEQERQTISLGHKGNLYVDLIARGTERPWPSRYTLFPNPAWTLTWALASLKGPDERVLVPGFYDGVRPVSDAEEREVYASLADDTASLRARAGIPAFVLGVDGQAALRRLYGEPSLAITGFHAGATGPGQQLILPHAARAKIEFRLVPDQDPEAILAALRQHLDDRGFEAVELEVQGMCPPYKIDADTWLPQLVKITGNRIYRNGAILTPVATGIGKRYVFRRWLDMPIVGFAIGYAGYQIETNDEHIRIEDYREQVKWVAAILDELAKRAA